MKKKNQKRNEKKLEQFH